MAIDKADWPEVVGTISGDDTIFIATADARGAAAPARTSALPLPGLNPMTNQSDTGAKPIVLAYSGGLDTSFLVPWLEENYRRPVITVTVDTGGIDAAAAQAAARARAGARRHRAPPGRRARRLLRAGAALPDHGQRAPRPALSAVRRRRARHAGADHRAHGAQARHRHRSRTAAPPPATTRCASRSRCARSRRSSRSSRRCATRRSSARRSCDYLEERKLPVPPYGAAYSINRGLWGVTIGGKETLTSDGQHSGRAPGCCRKDAFTQAARAASATRSRFERGRPARPRRRDARRRWS